MTALSRRALLLATALAVAMGTAVAEEACTLSAIGSADVAAVRDGRTLLLADGRELRLQGIEAGEGGRAVLARLADGQTLRLEQLAETQDRHGRLIAFAFAGDAAQSLQQALLEQGEARVAARVGSRACAEPLLAAERAARAARRGLWADPNFAPLRAENLAGIGSRAGRFALVEGKVLSVNVSGGTIYLNFGRRWISGFSVIILRQAQRRFAAAGIEPKRLQDRRIRVRGWIERRRGPAIVASAPEQIEDLGAGR